MCHYDTMSHCDIMSSYSLSKILCTSLYSPPPLHSPSWRRWRSSTATTCCSTGSCSSWCWWASPARSPSSWQSGRWRPEEAAGTLTTTASEPPAIWPNLPTGDSLFCRCFGQMGVFLFFLFLSFFFLCERRRNVGKRVGSASQKCAKMSCNAVLLAFTLVLDFKCWQVCDSHRCVKVTGVCLAPTWMGSANYWVYGFFKQQHWWKDAMFVPSG